jgi:hypothetical protein
MSGLILPNDFRPEGGIWTPRIFEGGRCPCPCCSRTPGCYACAASTTPSRVQVVIQGLQNRTPPTCADCANLNGTYVLQQCDRDACWYCYDIDTTCGFNSIRATLTPLFGSLYVSVSVHYCACCATGGIATTLGASNNLATAPPSPNTDCRNINGLVLDQLSSSSECLNTGPFWTFTAL